MSEHHPIAQSLNLAGTGTRLLDRAADVADRPQMCGRGHWVNCWQRPLHFHAGEDPKAGCPTAGSNCTGIPTNNIGNSSWQTAQLMLPYAACARSHPGRGMNRSSLSNPPQVILVKCLQRITLKHRHETRQCLLRAYRKSAESTCLEELCCRAGCPRLVRCLEENFAASASEDQTSERFS